MTTRSTHRRATARRLSEQTLFDRDGRLSFDDGFCLYQHDRSQFIYADFRPSVGLRESTKATTVQQAKIVARRRLKDLLRRVEAGQPASVRGPSVGDLLNAYLRDLETQPAVGDTSAKPEIAVLKRNFIPFWSGVSLAELNRQAFYAWERWRQTEQVTSASEGSDVYHRAGSIVRMNRAAKAPLLTTLAREKSYFVRALAWGADQVSPWLSDEAVHEIRYLPRRQKRGPKHGAAKEQRHAFEPDEITALMEEFARIEQLERDRVCQKGEAGRRKNYERRLMALHVRLLLASGLRPGKEILDLTWSQIKAVTTEAGREIVVIDRCGDGKTGPRVVNCDPAAVVVIDDLRRLHREFGFEIKPEATLWPSRRGDHAIVQDFNKSFKSVVRKLKLASRVQGEPLYICRHTYITERLRQGVSSDLLATNCGTSVEMIERHYKHLKAEQIRDKLLPTDGMGPLKLIPAAQGHGIKLRLGEAGLVTVR